MLLLKTAILFPKKINRWIFTIATTLVLGAEGIKFVFAISGVP